MKIKQPGSSFPSSRFKIKTNGNTRTLTIRRLCDSDAGEYRCVATNREGEAETSCNLEVVDFVEKERSDAPQFLKKIGDELVFRGMSARFTALVRFIKHFYGGNFY